MANQLMGRGSVCRASLGRGNPGSPQQLGVAALGRRSERSQIPTSPEFPVIAKPNPALTISPGGHALFYIGIPASLEVHGQCDGTLRKFASISTESLSNSWHGDRSAGQVCYALRTRARRSFDPSDWPEHDIVVAVDLKKRKF
jgi:hypothetical protein